MTERDIHVGNGEDCVAVSVVCQNIFDMLPCDVIWVWSRPIATLGGGFC